MSKETQEAIQRWLNPILLAICGFLLAAQLINIQNMRDQQVIIREKVSELMSEFRNLKWRVDRLEERINKHNLR